MVDTGWTLRLGTAAAVAVLVGTLAGCGGEADPGLPQLPTPAVSPSAGVTQAPEPTVDPRRLEVLAAYEEFVAAVTEATTSGDPMLPRLLEVADGGALIEVQEGIDRQNSLGQVYTGGLVVVTAEVTQFDPQARAPQPAATVRACVDVADYVLVDAATGEPVGLARDVQRFVTVSQLWHADSGWVVMSVDSLEEPC